jgi:putative ABC transport system ATP-binding protein
MFSNMGHVIRSVQIEVIGVGKSYGRSVVLHNVSLSIQRGEFVAVVGRSGSGKSTLLKLIGGLSTPDCGRVLHLERDLTRMTETERAHFRRKSLGFVFQFFNLIPTLTAGENVALPLALNGHKHAARAADELLAELGLTGCSGRFPDELSGGEQQRIAIARALVHEPELVVADEPTGNLDLETAAQVMQLLHRSCRERGTTLIVATHSQGVAEHADRVIAIRNAELAGAET